jgi:hypothetical protein
MQQTNTLLNFGFHGLKICDRRDVVNLALGNLQSGANLCERRKKEKTTR